MQIDDLFIATNIFNFEIITRRDIKIYSDEYAYLSSFDHCIF